MPAASYILLNALEQVTQDASFETSSPVAAQAAKQLLRSSEEPRLLRRGVPRRY